MGHVALSLCEGSGEGVGLELEPCVANDIVGCMGPVVLLGAWVQ